MTDMERRPSAEQLRISALHATILLFWCVWPPTARAFQIAAEKPTEMRIRACTHELKPYHLDTMLFFPADPKYCVSVQTSKGGAALAKDQRRTTFLQSTVSTVVHEIGSPHRCRIDFMGYGGEYRLTPDFGYYVHCQKPLSKYINQLMAAGNDRPVELPQNASSDNVANDTDTDGRTETMVPSWNHSSANCPIQNLPNTYMDLLACELHADKWYELHYGASIHYEVFRDKYYHQLWSNYSTTFLFKTEAYVDRAGTELYWLQRLVQLKVKMSSDCRQVRYLLNVDEDWPLRIRVFIDYQVRENAYVKHLRHIGNGTLDKWFSGTFALIPQRDRTHEVCAQLVWQGSRNRFRLCRIFAYHHSCAATAQHTIADHAASTKLPHLHYYIAILFLLYRASVISIL